MRSLHAEQMWVRPWLHRREATVTAVTYAPWWHYQHSQSHNNIYAFSQTTLSLCTRIHIDVSHVLRELWLPSSVISDMYKWGLMNYKCQHNDKRKQIRGERKMVSSFLTVFNMLANVVHCIFTLLHSQSFSASCIHLRLMWLSLFIYYCLIVTLCMCHSSLICCSKSVTNKVLAFSRKLGMCVPRNSGLHCTTTLPQPTHQQS